MPSSLDDSRLTTLGLLAEVYEGLRAKIAPKLAAHGLAEAEFGVLLRLARSPNHRLRMTELAAQTSLTSSGITRVMDRLVDRGLASREPCPSDRRSTYAVISTAGLQRIESVLPEHLELTERWLVGLLDPDQLGQLEAALRTVRDAVRPCATAGADAPSWPEQRSPRVGARSGR